MIILTTILTITTIIIGIITAKHITNCKIYKTNKTRTKIQKQTIYYNAYYDKQFYSQEPKEIYNIINDNILNIMLYEYLKK